MRLIADHLFYYNNKVQNEILIENKNKKKTKQKKNKKLRIAKSENEEKISTTTFLAMFAPGRWISHW